MFSFKSIYFVIFTLILCNSRAEISDKRLCIDEKCSERISTGKTLIKYPSPEDNILSFAPNEDGEVYSYGAGTRPDLIGVKIKGRRGYINKIHFKETSRIKRPQLLVDTELLKNKPDVTLEGAATEIKADPTQQPFEIIDGTRIPSDVSSYSTEVAEANLVNEQSTKEITKPLDSVPDNQNVDPAILKEPNIVNTEENENTEPQEQQQQPTDPVNNEDEDSDEEDDQDPEDITIEEDEVDKERESEAENTEFLNKGSLENATSSDNRSVAANDVKKDDADALHSTSDDGLESKEAPSETKLNEESVNVEYKVEEALNIDNSSHSADVQQSEKPRELTLKKENTNDEEIKSQSSQNDEAVGNILASTTEKNQIIAEYDTKIAENDNEFVPISAILKAGVEDGGKETSNEPINEDLERSLERNVTESVENIDNTLENKLNETQELNHSEKSPSPPVAVTETPLDIVVAPPVTLDSVTEDPVSSQNTNSTGEIGKTDAEDTTLTNKDNEISEESAHNKPHVGSEFFFSDDDSDSSKRFNSEQPERNIEPLELEDKPAIIEQNDLSENLNADLLKHNNVEEIVNPSAERVSDNQNGGLESIIDTLKSFFGVKKSEDVVSDGDQEVVIKESLGAPASNDSELEDQNVIQNGELNVNSHNPWSSSNLETTNEGNKFCDKMDHNCHKYQVETDRAHQEKNIRSNGLGADELQILFIEAFSSDLFLYLATTALSVIILVFGMVILDKCRREGPLIARINKLEQQLLTTMKENEMLQEKSTSFVEEKTQLVVETVPNEVVEELNQKLAEVHLVKLALEEQVQALEKELDTSTEVGTELNKIISEMLNSSDGSEIIKENIEQMQKKLLDQQYTINTVNETLNLKETENHELRLEMEISNRKVTDLQSELDKMVEKILKIEEERDQQHSALENYIIVHQTKCKEALSKEQGLNSKIQVLKQQVAKFQHIAEIKVKEYTTLKESLNELKAVKNNKDVLKSLLEVSEIRAQLEQFKSENLKYSEQLAEEREANVSYVAKIENLTLQVNELREKYELTDKEKVEISTKLQVLNNYFKEKEDQMQKEISKYESLWAVKEGEATSTTERIRYMQEELHNYKAQNESLKQEIVNQEVELKSQISMLEKKAHESWVANRQTERKWEEARQEAAQLRNRLTLRERAIAEGINQTRIQSPLHQNGELPISPPILDPTQSPPPLFNPRDHLAKSPPIPGLPPPFLPPPLGATPFIPPPPLEGILPPLGDMGGMPPPPYMMSLPAGMLPGDHRPPPLGRMSSPPPVGGRYTPESTLYSDYDRYSRRSPSPPYDSEYGASPPPIRGYSPYQDRLRDDRREYKRPQARSNGRNSKGVHSSGSENDSLGKINKKPQRKV